jgi:hypothetical protein
VPIIQPMTIQGQRAPTPYYWGPTFGEYRPRRDGVIPGPYTPMGVPAVLVQPPRYAAPGSPDRQQSPLAQGPRPGVSAQAGMLQPVDRPEARDLASPRFDRDRLTHQRDVIVAVGDGVQVRGRIEGERFRLGFTIGGHPFFVDRFGFAHDISRGGYCLRGAYGSWGAAYPLYYDYGYGYWHAPVLGTLAVVNGTTDPFVSGGSAASAPSAVPPAMDESVLPAVERGHLALQRGRAADAVGFYKAHLAVFESDGAALRWLAVALLDDGQPAEAAAVMMLAYSTDLMLATVPMSASGFCPSDGGLPERVARAVANANASKTGSAFLLAAVLAQADERPAVARRLVERARAVGLNKAIDAALSSALQARKPAKK